MIYTIENSELKVQISDKGAELVSVVKKNDGTEYLWQADPEYWDGRAPILFPVCGRFYDLKYTYKGQLYELGCHGFGWTEVYRVSEHTDDSITFELEQTPETLAVYPFDFNFKVRFVLDKNTVRNEFVVKNTGNERMYFSVGAHPGFNVPLEEGEGFEDYYIDFGTETFPEIIHDFHDGSGFEPYKLSKNRFIPLTHSAFDDDGIFLRNTPGSVAIRSRKSDREVEVSYSGFPYIGIWHAPFTDAKYVCVEPWYSLPCSTEVPDISKDVDMISLEPQCVYNNCCKFKIV